MKPFNLCGALFIICFLISSMLVARNSEAVQSDTVELGACRTVVEAANQGRLDTLAISDRDLEKIDLNNDGVPERVKLGDGSLSVYAADDGQPIELLLSNENNWEGENLSSATDYLLLKVDQHVYILGREDERLQYLAIVDKRNIEKAICEFGIRQNPAEILIQSKNDTLCREALTQSVDYVKFDRFYAISNEDARAAGINPDATFSAAQAAAGLDRNRQISNFAAYVDINNDGDWDYVVALRTGSGGGRTCDGVRLWALNKARNRQNEVISQQLPEWVCGDLEQAPFLFERQSYIKVKGGEGRSPIHRVVQLKDGHLNEVCQFGVKTVYYLLGD